MSTKKKEKWKTRTRKWRVIKFAYPAKIEVMQTAEPTAMPASSPICQYGNMQIGKIQLYLKIIWHWWHWYDEILTALVSVATAEVINIMEKVTTISMIRAWKSDPEGDVVPTCFIGCNNTRSVNDAEIAPVSWATP